MTASNPTAEAQKCSLTPPDIASLIGQNESFKASEEQEETVLEASREHWYHIASLASTYLEDGLAPEFTTPQTALRKVPRLQKGLKEPFRNRYCYNRNEILSYQAHSTWTFGDPECDAAKKETTRSAILLFGVSGATPYSFTGRGFNHWPGTISETATGPNYLGILAIGWCYILSAEFIEIQGGSAVMQYGESCARVSREDVDVPPEEIHIIDVGNADERAVRWWSAILAKNTGWKPTLTDNFDAPWSVYRTCDTSFLVKHTGQSAHPEETPPYSKEYKPLSSEEAFDALLEFASLHNVGSQFPIALAIAMSFSVLQWYGADAKLPPPTADGARVPSSPLGPLPEWKDLKKNLPYYMTLSCNSDAMVSTLCGAFWQLNVPANMVTPWLHPITEEVLHDVSEDGQKQELCALIGAIRRPGVSALWIGAAITGIGPRLLKEVKIGSPPLETCAFPWTGAPQNFMDVAGSGPYLVNDVTLITLNGSECILRRDAWRLLYIPPVEDDDLLYNLRAWTPWEPNGTSFTTNCALRVRSHLNCSRHIYHYDYLTWESANGESVRDYGFLNTSPSRPTELSTIPDHQCTGHTFQKKELDPKREASERASLDIFRWALINGEGIPTEDIWGEDGIREMSEDILGDEYGPDEPVQLEDNKPKELDDKKKVQLEAWLGKIDLED